MHKIQHGDCKNIQVFITKIRDIRSEIEDLEITIDEAITVQILNSLDLFFIQFFAILSHKAREKAKLFTFENLVKSLDNKEFWMKNQDKIMANYAKRFTKMKVKLPSN